MGFMIHGFSRSNSLTHTNHLKLIVIGRKRALRIRSAHVGASNERLLSAHIVVFLTDFGLSSNY